MAHLYDLDAFHLSIAQQQMLSLLRRVLIAHIISLHLISSSSSGTWPTSVQRTSQIRYAIRQKWRKKTKTKKNRCGWDNSWRRQQYWTVENLFVKRSSAMQYQERRSWNKIDVVRQCRQYFNFELPSVSIANRAAKFHELFHTHNSGIIMQQAYWWVAVVFLLFTVKLLFFSYQLYIIYCV